MITKGGLVEIVFGLLGVCFFGLGFVVFMDRRVRRTRLALTSDAIQVRSFRSRIVAQIPYDNIASVGISEDEDYYFVSITLVDKNDASTNWSPPSVLQYKKAEEDWDLLIDDDFYVDPDDLTTRIKTAVEQPLS